MIPRSLRRFFPAVICLALTTLGCRGDSPDLQSSFAADQESWRASDPAATLAWEASGGVSGGYLKGGGTGSNWYFVSPAAWSGDRSAYKVLKFDLAIPSRHYATNDSGGMVVLVGANSNTMTWTGPTPIWTWSHYEVSLAPASFGVDQATFDGIMANLAEVRILAEFTTGATEEVGLDSVTLTTTPVQVLNQDLVERFTGSIPEEVNSILAGWSRVDDVNFFSSAEGQPLYSLRCDDWQDGRLFKVASPVAWAGDWRNFTEIRFDLRWTSSGTVAGTDLLKIFGANGQQLTWSTPLTKNQWMKIVVPLTPEAFGVDAATFEGVMSYVNKIWIQGEYDNGDDQFWLDNIEVATGPVTPRVFGNSLVARFGTGPEGWLTFDAATLGWNATAGFTGGAITSTDTGTGLGRFASPDTWSGDWRNFATLRFMMKTLSASRADLSPVVTILGFNGSALTVTPPGPYNSWTPYTFDLIPATFGVTQGEFDAVMSNVAHVTISGDLVNGNDTSVLDEVSLLPDGEAGGAPPDFTSGFDTDGQGWRKGGENGGAWTILAAVPEYRTDGNPGGCIAAEDNFSITNWLSPEAWAGDWRGYESVAFDLKIITGTALLVPGTMLSIISVHGVLSQPVAQAPALGQWNHYEFALTPQAFGVTQEQFDRVMRDVVVVGIRSEWINGAEKEALDNVRLSKAPEAYWLWISGYLNPGQLGDEAVAGKTVDLDHDGRDNWEEYLALTLPTDPLSRFTASGRTAGANFEVEYPTKSGRVYQVWRSTTLSGWAPVGPLVPGDDLIKTYGEPRTDPAAFFRVEVDLP